MTSAMSIRVALRGGLGNQLFGWAAGFSLAERLHLPLELVGDGIEREDTHILDPRVFELDYFGLELTAPFQPGRLRAAIIEGKFPLSRFLKRSKSDVFRESGFDYDAGFESIPGPTVLDGYFQSWRYFHAHQESIRKALSLRGGLGKNAQDLADRLSGSPWIGVHIRRGDYAKVGVMVLPNTGYYGPAIALAKSESGATRVVVFSDDIAAAREVVGDADDYVGPKDVSEAGDVLVLLSRSSALVGANSSLSWWASYLHEENSALKIFPSQWFTDPKILTTDLLLPNWYTLPLEA